VRANGKHMMLIHTKHLETMGPKCPSGAHRVLMVSHQLCRKQERVGMHVLTEGLLAIPWIQFVRGSLGAPAAGGLRQSGRENQL
jgi:hypothetical protein